jgi:tRNA-2-methylthio-N6-dimethylallyladenosine synthase
VACKKNIGLLGTKVEVLVEGMARRGELLQSRTRTNKVVLIDGPAEWIGSYLTVRLTGTTGATFTGVPTPTGKELAIVG